MDEIMSGNGILAEGIIVRRGGRTILAAERLRIQRREVTAILGHNGSGKSTLLNLLARQARPDDGAISIDGAPIMGLSQGHLARAVAYLPQRLPNVAGLSVRELVFLGRYAWRGALGRWRDEDRNAVESAMARTGVDRHADRMADELSGGERQRAWIAMLLAQNSPFLLLDEPTSALDLAHQYEIMSLLAALAHENGRGVVVVLHDINLAARFADRIVVLKDGVIAFDGPGHELLAPDLLSRLCGLDMRLVDHPTAATRVAVVNW